MCDKREFLQRYPPDVLLLLDGSSDIHYGKATEKTKIELFYHTIIYRKFSRMQKTAIECRNILIFNLKKILFN